MSPKDGKWRECPKSNAVGKSSKSDKERKLITCTFCRHTFGGPLVVEVVFAPQSSVA